MWHTLITITSHGSLITPLPMVSHTYTYTYTWHATLSLLPLLTRGIPCSLIFVLLTHGRYGIVFEGDDAAEQFHAAWGDNITVVGLHYLIWNYCLQVGASRPTHIHHRTLAPEHGVRTLLTHTPRLCSQHNDKEGKPLVDEATRRKIECAYGVARRLQAMLGRHPTREEIDAVLRAVKEGYIEFLELLAPALLHGKVHVMRTNNHTCATQPRVPHTTHI